MRSPREYIRRFVAGWRRRTWAGRLQRAVAPVAMAVEILVVACCALPFVLGIACSRAYGGDA